MDQPPSHAFSSDEKLTELLNQLVQDFRLGVDPKLDEYCQQYPELEKNLRELFPTLCFIESNKPKTKADSLQSNLEIADSGRIGDYQIIREVGRGGMGIVYEALQISLQRHVALKVMSPLLVASESAVARFRREARAAAHLHHSNIVPVFEVWTENSVCFYAMQFIQGQSLDQVLNELRQQVNRDSSEWEGEDEKALPSQPSRTGNVLAASLSQYDVAKRSNAACPKDSSSPTNSLSRRNYHRNVARIGLQIAEGLAYAEARNVVHRDIKPSNIMLDREGTAWITDFGLAKKATGMGQGDSEPELTNEGDFLGTLRYLAPERLRGKHDAQGDIYGLGATLYELLTLTPIFDSHDRLSLMKDIADRAPVALKKREPYVPRDLETIVQKCLAKEPSGRYLSARQLADDLQLFLLDRPIRARRQNWMEKIVRWGRKNKLVASLVGTSLLLFIALILGVGVNRVLQKERDTAFAMLKRAESAESDAEARLLLNKVAAYRMSGSAGITQFLRPMEALPLDRLSAPVLEELRNEWASCLMKLDVIPGEPIEVKAQVACIDRQGERIAAISDGNQVSISDRVGPHRSSKQYSLGLEPTELRFSEAGDHLVASAMDFHQVLCVENGGKTFPAKPILACCCDVDGQNELTAFCRFDKSVEVFSIASEDFGKEHSSLKLDIQAKACRFSRDGRYIAVLGHDEDEVRLIDRTRGGRVSTVPGMSATAMAWSPDSRYLAIACEGRVIKTWDIETMSIIATLIGHQSQIVQIDWHPSKNLLQSRSWDNATILWNPTSAEQFLHFNSMSSSVEFSESNTIGWSRAGSCWTPLEMTEPFFRDTSVISNHTSGVVQFLVPETKDGIVGVVYSDQIQLYELATGRILQSLPAESTFSASFNEAQSELLTLQRDMIHRWRIKRMINRIGQRTWDLSLPEILPIPGMMSGFSTDDGQSAVVSISGLAPKLAKIDLESGVTQKQFGHHKIGDEVRLVGAGPLCAVSSWHANEINFWNYETEAFYGKMEVPRYSSWVASRDGRHLAILHHDTIEFWDLPLLKRMETISLDGFMAANVATFSRDGDFLYTRSATNRVCVIDMAMKRIVLRIDEDKHVSPNSFQFLSSGELAEVNASIGRVRLWNLRELNRRFQDLHIGWRKDNSSRFFLPEPGIEGDESSLAGITSTQSFGTLALKKQLERVHFETNAETDTTMSLDAKAQIKMLEKKLKDSPRNISLLNQLAWTLLVAPPQLRDDQKAVELAQSAASSNPDDPNVRNTLALSLFRVHRNAEAKKLLQENLKSQPSIFLHLDLIILSMVEIREGDFAKSELFAEWANRSWLDNAASSGRKWLEFQMLVDERNALLQSTAH